MLASLAPQPGGRLGPSSPTPLERNLMKLHPGSLVSGVLVVALSAAVASAQNPAGNTARPGGKLPKNVSVQLVEVAGGFVDPIHAASPRDGTGRLFVCERPGVIRIVDKNGKVLDEPFYDNKANTMFQFLEEGLYCIEFHPRFKENGLVYISYADMWFNGSTFIVEYKVDKSEPNKVDM